eukprot:CAMPEP_0197285594 /NCGR_PEP_ID=MMETSP0890-20130614/940_1 /TAXON_ID=44058 ORGANISM="Aureoumbra lagunensis, Strain CCMP1510" /NCGR_SAMPLE_ID=MMETSP0890 /ASSEMBLY_ACC=CAM_ASM_000533 /LENGTH=148 /DNA_ID=CAMNT_0042753265 /DNA_START=163 /DNA_END=609 /DNA_ORIENTATION=+
MKSERTNTNSDGTAYTWEAIKEVQSLIERCMQHYMTQTEIIATLQVQAEVEPALTCLVWQKLEEQNPNYFMSYQACLRLKDQIVAFNYLVEQQTRLLQKLTVSLPNNAQLNNNTTELQQQQQQALQQQQIQQLQQQQQQQSNAPTSTT